MPSKYGDALKGNAHWSEPVAFVKGQHSFRVTLKYRQEEGVFTGLCVELGISAFGDDRQEAEAALIEAVILQVEAHENAGTLNEFLERGGVTLELSKQAHWNPVNPHLIPA
jgi:hypothetical protein